MSLLNPSSFKTTINVTKKPNFLYLCFSRFYFYRFHEEQGVEGGSIVFEVAYLGILQTLIHMAISGKFLPPSFNVDASFDIDIHER